MPITIRNKKTEDLVRKIGLRTGEGPSAVVRRLAEQEIGSKSVAKSVPEDIVEQRMRELEASRLRHRYADDPKVTWSDLEKEMDSIFDDETDLRRARG